MATVRREHQALRIGINRSRTGLELPVEEVVEGSKACHGLLHLFFIDLIALNEGSDQLPTLGTIHPRSVPVRKHAALHQRMERDPPQRVLIRKTQEPFAINRLLLDGLRTAVEIADGITVHRRQFEPLTVACKQRAPQTPMRMTRNRFTFGVGVSWVVVHTRPLCAIP